MDNNTKIARPLASFDNYKPVPLIPEEPEVNVDAMNAWSSNGVEWAEQEVSSNQKYWLLYHEGRQVGEVLAAKHGGYYLISESSFRLFASLLEVRVALAIAIQRWAETLEQL